MGRGSGEAVAAFGLKGLGLAVALCASGCAHRAGSAGEPPAPPAATQGGGAAPAPTPAPAVAPAPAPAAAPQDVGADKLLVTETEYQGWKFFQVYCARCHGEDALGTMTVPNLTFSVSPDGSITRDSFVVIVQSGLATTGMKGFGDVLEDQQIANIYAYVKARSEGRLGRGRPHRAPESP